MLQIACTFNIFFYIYVPYYARLLHMLGFLLSPKKAMPICYKPSGLFKNLKIDNQQLQIIESISPQSICREFISPVGYFFYILKNKK